MAINQGIDFLFSFKVDPRGAVIAEQRLKSVERAMKRQGFQAKLTSTQTSGLSQNLVRLASRAALTIPVWFALRAALSTILTPLTLGAKRMVDFSKAMTKARVTIFSDVTDIEATMGRLGDAANALARKTGIAADKIVQSFQKFATVGLTVEESLAGMNAATQAAVLFQGDAVEIGRTLALTYRLLGDTTEKALRPQDRMTLVVAKLFKLWQKNAFEINELTQSLNNFLATANIANISLDQTLALLSVLSTAGLQSGRGGRLLRTSFQKFEENLVAVRKTLGLVVLDTDNLFDAFVAFLGKIKELDAAGKNAEARRAIREVVPGIRGAEPIRALIALYDQLKEAIDRVRTSDLDDEAKKLKITELFENFAEAGEQAEASLERQVARFTELRTQSGQTFLTAITGAGDFAKAMNTVNTAIESSIGAIKLFGEAIHDALTEGLLPPFVEDMVELANKLTPDTSQQKEDAPSIIDKAKTKFLEFVSKSRTGGKPTGAAVFASVLLGKKEEKGLSFKDLEKLKENEKRIAQENLLTLKTEERITKLRNELAIIQLEALAIDSVTIAQEKFRNVITETIVELNNGLSIEGKQRDAISATEIEALALQGRWEEILELLKGIGDRHEIIKKLVGEANKVQIAQLERLKAVSKDVRSTLEGSLTAMLKGDGNLFAELEKGFTNIIAKGFSKAIVNAILKTQFAQAFNQVLGKIVGLQFLSGSARAKKAIISGFSSGSVQAKTSILSGFQEGSTIAAQKIKDACDSCCKCDNKGGEGHEQAERVITNLASKELTDSEKRDVDRGVKTAAAASAVAPEFAIIIAAVVAAATVAVIAYGRIKKAFKPQFETIIETQQFQVASRIDLTNNKLDIVNRNLVALRTTFETFILPQSAFFSETRGTLEDQFSLAGRRGGI